MVWNGQLVELVKQVIQSFVHKLYQLSEKKALQCRAFFRLY